MVPWVLLVLPLVSPAIGALDKTYGVQYNLLPKYFPSKANTWKCLDGTKDIPWDFVNDDSCDCPDGSDEPGTSACSNGVFFCHNVGHIGNIIPSSRVRDGLCEPECCDGSDERPGICENTCKVLGDEYRKNYKEERKIQRTGAKIRSTYIGYAVKEKARLEIVLQTLKEGMIIKEKEVSRLQDIADRTDSLSKATLEHNQASPLYQSLIRHSTTLKSLQAEYKKHLEQEKALGQILDALRTGYNPNYQDMAVLEAVRGWEELANLPHINDVGKEGLNAEKGNENAQEGVDVTIAAELDQQVRDLLETDYISLLLEHDEHIRAPHDTSILFDIASYLPDVTIPYFDVLQDGLLSWLYDLGILKESIEQSATGSSRAHQAYTEADNDLQRAKKEITSVQDELNVIFDPYKFGASGEWKKLDGVCIEKDTGDYTYEVCLFKEIKQKPNNGGTTFSLGQFDSWNNEDGITPVQSEFYHKQFYKRGTRCWNGPERNVVLKLTCGLENAILTVQELEKCEYEFSGTSPALCLPATEEADKREEL